MPGSGSDTVAASGSGAGVVSKGGADWAPSACGGSADAVPSAFSVGGALAGSAAVSGSISAPSFSSCIAVSPALAVVLSSAAVSTNGSIAPVAGATAGSAVGSAVGSPVGSGSASCAGGRGAAIPRTRIGSWSRSSRAPSGRYCAALRVSPKNGSPANSPDAGIATKLTGLKRCCSANSAASFRVSRATTATRTVLPVPDQSNTRSAAA